MKTCSLLVLFGSFFSVASEITNCSESTLNAIEVKNGTLTLFKMLSAACATDIGVSYEDLYSPDSYFTDGQFYRLAKSANCQSTYELDAQSFAYLSPKCYVNEFGFGVLSSDLATYTWNQFANERVLNTKLYTNCSEADLIKKQKKDNVLEEFKSLATNCAKNISKDLSVIDLYSPKFKWTKSQLETLAKSQDCKDAYELDATSFMSLRPVCYVNEFGHGVLSSDFAKYSWEQFVAERILNTTFIRGCKKSELEKELNSTLPTYQSKYAACANDVGLLVDDLSAADIKLPISKLKILANSTNCRAAFELGAKSFVYLKPQCYVNLYGYSILSSNLASYTWARFLRKYLPQNTSTSSSDITRIVVNSASVNSIAMICIVALLLGVLWI